MVKPLKFLNVCLLLVWLGLGLVADGQAEERFAELQPGRIAEIATVLPDLPAGFGRPASDRAFWSSAELRRVAGEAVGSAEKMLWRTLPPWSDALYLDYSRTGQRAPGEKMLKARYHWLQPLVLAECVEIKGRFLPLLNHVLTAYASDPCWNLPAHDDKLGSFHRDHYSVDLASATFGAEIAQTLYWLGDRLDPAVRQQIYQALTTRVFDPVRESLVTGQGTFWLGSRADSQQNNWNAVCLAGVVGAARTVLPDRHERAVFVAAGEHYSRYFINSFGADGYCTEGPGYYHYGFGNYVVLRAILPDATGGRLELFSDEKITNIAAYGVRIQMLDGAVPPFEDCRFGTLADAALAGYCNQVLQLGLPTANCGTALARTNWPLCSCR